ncbi:FUSC family protein [Streptomyces yunnanensis]|uniref:Fusaric acid resistance protein-like n=1 Tax=Streptomyces yunnanensis TaxID=156453 RepID=A0A9X8R0I4_9ACTN|nr:FUSC family protein [Streptomyces yunnanensis]SHN34935.1 Fusaric acid resistance protein-like [Streptomyces yunnanensis]
MRHARHAREPHWSRHLLRLRPGRTPYAAMLRAALAIAGPLAVGMASGNAGPWTMVALGALPAVLADHVDGFRARLTGIGLSVLAAIAGLMVGMQADGRGWQNVAVLTLAAFVSGFVSVLSQVASAAGMVFLVLTVVGAGMPMPGPWWQPPLLQLLGGLTVLTLSLLGWALLGRRATPAVAPARGDRQPGRTGSHLRELMHTPVAALYGLRVAVCIALAGILTMAVDLPRPYWIAATIAFVLKPDFGHPLARGVLRSVGTVGGVLIAGAALIWATSGGLYLAVITAAAVLLPWASARNYALQTGAVTALILLLSDQLSHTGPAVLVPRLTDSLIGIAIVAVAGHLLWPHRHHARVGFRLPALAHR